MKKKTVDDNGEKLADIYVHTNDNWCPNYPGNKVRVGGFVNAVHHGQYWHRVYVWGDDDLGMEKDFLDPYLENTQEVISLYKMLIIKKSIDFKYLRSLGFVNA